MSGEWKGFDGALHATSGSYVWLRHTTPFADFVLKVDFRMRTVETDSGIFLRAAQEGDPSRTGYQININNRNKDYGNGSIVYRVKSDAEQLNGCRRLLWHILLRGIIWPETVGVSVRMDEGRMMRRADSGKAYSRHLTRSRTP